MTLAADQHERILILDFGSQVTQLIARRIRESGTYCEILPFNADPARLRAFGAKGVVLSGSHDSATRPGAPEVPEAVLDLGVPMLGICYGQQALIQRLGGHVAPGDHQEFGRATLEVRRSCPLFDGVWAPGDRPTVWMSHGDRVTEVPPGFAVVATSPGAPCAVVADAARGYYGVQFHPEVVHTPDGAALLRAFVRDICGCAGDWGRPGLARSGFSS